MAKLPGWLRYEGQRVEDGGLVMLLTVRWWHPGLWWAMLRRNRGG